jgi:hypothetical protein
VPYTLNSATLQAGIEDWLTEEGVYQIARNRRAASENLQYATLRIMRGSEQAESSSRLLGTIKAVEAARRLRRAAKLFENLADRLED